MSAYSLFRSNSATSSKNFPKHYFENALNYLLNNNAFVLDHFGGLQGIEFSSVKDFFRRYTSILRCALQGSEVFSQLDLHVDAAVLLIKLTQLVGLYGLHFVLLKVFH